MVATVLHGQATVKSLQVSHQADGLWASTYASSRLPSWVGSAVLVYADTFGDCETYIEDDVTKIHQLIAHAPHDYSAGVLVPLLSLGYMFVVDWRIGLLGLVPLLLAVATMPFMMREFQEKAEKFKSSQKQLDAAVVELVRGIPVIKVFVPEATTRAFSLVVPGVLVVLSRVVARHRTPHRFDEDLHLHRVWPAGGSRGQPVAHHVCGRTGGRCAGSVLFINNIAAPLLMLSRTNIMFSEAKAAAADLTEFFNIPVLPPAAGGREPANAGIELKDLSFSYVPDTPVLSGINQNLP